MMTMSDAVENLFHCEQCGSQGVDGRRCPACRHPLGRGIYVAGPMTGRKFYNFPAFDEAEACLQQRGWQVFSPAALDRLHGFDAMQMPEDTDWSVLSPAWPIRKIIRVDVNILFRVDAVLMLPEWETSKGARAEYHLAKWLGLRVYDSLDSVPDFAASEAGQLRQA